MRDLSYCGDGYYNESEWEYVIFSIRAGQSRGSGFDLCFCMGRKLNLA